MATETVNSTGEAFTIDKLMQAMDLIRDMPPCPIFASCRMFSEDKAIKWTDGKQDYAVAHPAFWAKIPARTATVAETNDWATIKIIDIDLSANSNTRAKVLTSLASALNTTP